MPSEQISQKALSLKDKQMMVELGQWTSGAVFEAQKFQKPKQESADMHSNLEFCKDDQRFEKKESLPSMELIRGVSLSFSLRLILR